MTGAYWSDHTLCLASCVPVINTTRMPSHHVRHSTSPLELVVMLYLAHKGGKGVLHSLHLPLDRCQGQVQLLVTLGDRHGVYVKMLRKPSRGSTLIYLRGKRMLQYSPVAQPSSSSIGSDRGSPRRCHCSNKRTASYASVYLEYTDHCYGNYLTRLKRSRVASKLTGMNDT